MKKSALLASVLLGFNMFSKVSIAQAPPPPPPPPPPVPSERGAVNKATRIYSLAQTVVEKHKTYEAALKAALSVPNDPNLKMAVKLALDSLVESIQNLKRNVVSLEGDLNKLVQQELSGEKRSLSQEKENIGQQRGVKPKREESQEKLLEELQKKLKQRQGK